MRAKINYARRGARMIADYQLKQTQLAYDRARQNTAAPDWKGLPLPLKFVVINLVGLGATAPQAKPSGHFEPDWKVAALQCLHALRLMADHYDDISKSNPGFMRQLCLQRYDLWNEALLASRDALAKYADFETLNTSHGAKVGRGVRTAPRANPTGRQQKRGAR